MLRNASSLMSYHIASTDGAVGTVKDLLFDDRHWVVRYLVADPGRWLPGRRVLIVPAALGEPEWETGTLPVALTKKQIEDSPGIEADRPVSRQRELALHQYYGWSVYWTEPGFVAPPGSSPRASEVGGDPNLRSASEVTGYAISASDGEIGHVEDLIVDDEVWSFRWVVVDTRNWLPGKKVLVSPEWFGNIDWSERQVEVELSREQIKASPPYDPTEPVNRRYEERLFDYYGRPHYWSNAT